MAAPIGAPAAAALGLKSLDITSSSRGQSDAYTSNTADFSGWNVTTGGSKSDAGSGMPIVWVVVAAAAAAALYFIAKRKG
jgi:hypothetical protein